eukprot:c32356_g1_i1.p1 GENE.c32356_g1_i1~~c32356_g1_i1.p1  ORF type:complete len:118 (+),score=24.91 c32356_g1_i1:312-665(+)
MLAQLLTVVQYSALATLFFGDSIFGALGIRPPQLYLQAQENKAFSAFLVFMLGNQISGGLLTTGAFEIEMGHLASKCVSKNEIICRDLVGSEKLFSKLESGRFPEPSEIFSRVERRL